MVSRVVRAAVFAMAERFIGASDGQEALPVLRKLMDDGTAYAIDLLGEATLSEVEAQTYLARSLDLIRTVCTINQREDSVR